MHQSFETPVPLPGHSGGWGWGGGWGGGEGSGDNHLIFTSLCFPGRRGEHLLSLLWGMSGVTFDLSAVAFSRCLVIWTFGIKYLHSSQPCCLCLEMLFKVLTRGFKKGCHSRFYTHRTFVCTAGGGEFTGGGEGFKWLVHNPNPSHTRIPTPNPGLDVRVKLKSGLFLGILFPWGNIISCNQMHCLFGKMQRQEWYSSWLIHLRNKEL